MSKRLFKLKTSKELLGVILCIFFYVKYLWVFRACYDNLASNKTKEKIVPGSVSVEK